MKSRPECRSIQISFLIPFEFCGLGFVLELCHNALFCDTANLIWQLTAPRQSDLPFSLPFIPVLAMCTRLLSCPGSGTSLAPWRGGPVESTENYSSFFWHPIAHQNVSLDGQVSASAHKVQAEGRFRGCKGLPPSSNTFWDPSSVPAPSCEAVQHVSSTTPDLQLAVLNCSLFVQLFWKTKAPIKKNAEEEQLWAVNSREVPTWI